MVDDTKAQSQQAQSEQDQDVASSGVVQSEIKQLQNQCEQYKAGWQRAQADYQNLQKEVALQKSQWIKISEVQILEEFIPVYDNLKKALHVQIIENDEIEMKMKGWRQGIEYIMKQFANILQRHGVEEIKTAGEIFNPRVHEAVGEEESNTEENVIIREVEGGYKMGEVVVRIAKVIVSKKN